MIDPRLFLCSGGTVEANDVITTGRKIIKLDSIGSQANVNIRFENVAKVLQGHLSPRLMDLLEVAAYVYTADCSTQRGTEWSDEDSTEPWERDFSFVIPVRDPEFWDSVSGKVAEVLNFLSDDRYAFRFEPLKQERLGRQEYLEFGDTDDWPFSNPERVVMFSGGLDSLAGIVESARRGNRLVLVSHRPVATLSARQRELFQNYRRSSRSSCSIFRSGSTKLRTLAGRLRSALGHFSMLRWVRWSEPQSRLAECAFLRTEWLA